MAARPAPYEAVVYDLDGTLVRLAVDWSAVEREVAETLREEGLDPDDLVAWELLSAAERHGVGDRVHEIIAAHERRGAESARRLPAADELLAAGVPTGVVSLNAEEAVRRALAGADLLDAVGVVIGRDTVGARKPDPEPLLAACEALGVAPADALFVGDSDTDAETARRAGVAFRRV